MDKPTTATVPGTRVTITIRRERFQGSGTMSIVDVVDPDLLLPLSQAYRCGTWSAGQFMTMLQAREEANRIYRDALTARPFAGVHVIVRTTDGGTRKDCACGQSFRTDEGASALRQAVDHINNAK